MGMVTVGEDVTGREPLCKGAENEVIVDVDVEDTGGRAVSRPPISSWTAATIPCSDGREGMGSAILSCAEGIDSAILSCADGIDSAVLDLTGPALLSRSRTAIFPFVF
jgi:hypothetical protein